MTVRDLIRAAAARLGGTLEVLDPEYGYLIEVRVGARARVLVGGRSPLNDAVAARLAEDKHYTGLLLERAGYLVPRTVRCLKPEHFRLEDYDARAGPAPGHALATELGFPLVVKPNAGSRGNDVVLAGDLWGLDAAIARVWERDPIALVQAVVPGPDLRLDFLNGELLLGYERVPLEVTGDGARTVGALAAAIDPRFADRRRFDRAGVDPEAVPPAGARRVLGGPVLNLHHLVTARRIESISERWHRYCVGAAEALGLVHFGIDVRGAGLEGDPQDARVIELNASPLLVQAWEMGWTEAAEAAQVRVLKAILGL